MPMQVLPRARGMEGFGEIVILDDEDNIPCDEPCDPANNNLCCLEYWDRMRREGFWKDRSGWTEKGLREMRK